MEKTIPRARIIHIIRMAAGSPLLAREIFRFIGRVIRDFFLPQFLRASGLSSRPVVSVDHPLDRTVPFHPESAAVYLGFIRFWIDPLVHIWRTEGRAALPQIASFVSDLSRFYRGAGEVYRSVSSTTVRPSYLKSPRFVLIRLFDPHLNCVPSLHVIIACYSYRRIAQILDTFPSFPQRSLIAAQMEDEAVRIVESVLRIKQHSVNCVAAGLFFLGCCDGTFDAREALRFCGRLFSSEGSGCADAQGVRDCIAHQYRQFVSDYEQTGCARDVLVSFLENYIVSQNSMWETIPSCERE